MKRKHLSKSKPFSDGRPVKLANQDFHSYERDCLSSLDYEPAPAIRFLNSLSCKALEGDDPVPVFGCLRLLDENHGCKVDAIAIGNPCLVNQMILLSCGSDRFYFGIGMDGETSSYGVFPSTETVGRNVSLVNDRLIVILRTRELADSFLEFLSTSNTLLK